MSELKTLKDIKGEIGNAEYFFKEGQEPTNEYGDVVLVDDLRQEAIKWVKGLEYLLNMGARPPKEMISTPDFIKSFFNLTDEDLK